MTTEQGFAARAEALLAAVHDNLGQLQGYRQRLRHLGLRQEDLPDLVSLQAFALLGDHDRHVVEPEFGALRSIIDALGLLPIATTVPTPVMRLILHVAPLLASLEGLWDRLMHAEDVEPSTPEQLRCVSRVRGLWGQQARVHFAAADVAHLLIRPATVFGTESAVLTAGVDGRCHGSFMLPIDDGVVTLTLALRSGELRRHRIAVRIGQPPSAFY